MPLNLKEVPTESMVNELAARYPNFMLIGANEGFAGANLITDCMYMQGHILINMGLVKLLDDTLMQEWRGMKEAADDTP
jgi:hypothetical protein